MSKKFQKDHQFIYTSNHFHRCGSNSDSDSDNIYIAHIMRLHLAMNSHCVFVSLCSELWDWMPQHRNSVTQHLIYIGYFVFNDVDWHVFFAWSFNILKIDHTFPSQKPKGPVGFFPYPISLSRIRWLRQCMANFKYNWNWNIYLN